MKNKTLMMTVGLPRSGKSTWSRSTGLPIVNPDSIRLALYGQAYIKEAENMVWTITKYMVKSLFIAGHSTIILDATNLVTKRRNEWLMDDWRVKYKLFKASKEECIERAKSSNRKDLIPIIERMSEFIEWPDNNIVEGDFTSTGKYVHSVEKTKNLRCPECGD